VRFAACSAVFALTLLAGPAQALVWPDVPERMERDLASPDAAVRTSATERLDSLGPVRAAPLVLRSLGDTDAGVRVAAAEVAARLHVAGATALVIPWLGEHDGRLRLGACAVARAVPDVHAVGPLSRALSDTDSAVRASAAEALGAQSSPDAVPPLLGKLDDAIPGVRIELVRALSRLRDPRAVLPLIGKVEDPVPEVRQAVARALGDLGDPRAAAALVLQLRDASPEVRAGALVALGRVHATDSIDAITPSVTDRNPAVRHAALAALGGLAATGGAGTGSGAALAALVARLGLDDDATLELEPTPLREALVQAGGAAVAPLRAVLRAGASASSATSAAWVLGELRASEAAADVVAALRRGTLAPAAAMRALGALGAADDLPVVLEYVGSDATIVRHEALSATARLLDPNKPDGRAVEPLVAVAEGHRVDPSELVQLLGLLGRTRAPRAAATLTASLSSREVPTKLAALAALTELGPAGADAAIVPLLSDAAPEVRLRAADALASTGGAVARDALLELLDRGTELDRATALTALAGALVRAPSDRAFHRLSELLEHVVGGERDAVLAALGRAAPVHPVVERLASLEDADDRRTVMAALGGRPEALGLLAQHLADPDAGVRAQAAWSLGSVADRTSAGALAGLLRDQAPAFADVAVDAAGALARLARRVPDGASALCALLDDRRPLVRANALAGLALARTRCGDRERALLQDPYERVRALAASVLRERPTAADAAALAVCKVGDRSPEVAHACAGGAGRSEGKPHATLVYVEPATRGDPRPGASYLVELADGVLRAGTADRRGAFLDPVAPDGPVRLRRRPESP
jgi:HEAT repeat protein